jgi:hypothetical protein
MMHPFPQPFQGEIAEITISPYDTRNNVTKLQGGNGYRLQLDG